LLVVISTTDIESVMFSGDSQTTRMGLAHTLG